MKFSTVFAAAALAIAAAPGSATVLVSQGWYGTGGGVESDTAGIRSYEDFTAAASGNITDVFWSGSVTHVPGYYEPLANGYAAFTIEIYAAITPYQRGSLISSQVVNGYATPFNQYGVREFSAQLGTAVALDAGTTYFLSIQGNDLRGDYPFASAFSWGSGDSSAGTSILFSDVPGYGTVAQGVSVGFRLEDNAAEVPEPAMLGLFGLGALALAAKRRRR